MGFYVVHIVLLLVSFIILGNSEIFQFRLFPPCTKSQPLRSSRYYEIIPLSELPSDDVAIFVEKLSTVDFSVIETQNVTLKAPYISTYGKNWGKNWTFDKPEYIRVSVYDQQGELLFSPSPNHTIIYWNFEYYNLEYSFTYEENGIPGLVEIVAHPKTDYDIDLESLTRLWFFVSNQVNADGKLSRTYSWYGACDGSQSSNDNIHRVVFNRPRVYYWSIRGYANYGDGGIASPFYTLQQPMNDNKEFVGGAIVMCSESGDCPAVDPLFLSTGGPVYTAKNTIPGDVQLPILKYNVAVIEGGILFMRLFRTYFLPPYPNFVDVEIEGGSGITYGEWLNPALGTRFEMNTCELDDGNACARFDISSSWNPSNLPLIFKFDNETTVFGNEYKMWIRIENGDWQEVTIRPKKTKSIQELPKRMMTSFTWSSLSYYENLEAYKSFGFNQLMGPHYSSSESVLNGYTPEKRKEKYGDMLYCPENSIFYGVSAEKNLCHLFNTFEQSTTADAESCIPNDITGAQYTEEMTKIQNAIDYWVDSGSLFANGDMAYDGVIFQKHFEVLGNYLNITKPECINLDIEQWFATPYFKQNIHLSKNANDRRKSGESDEDLYKRILNEIFQKLQDVFEKYVPDSLVIWYAVQSINNYGCYGEHPASMVFDMTTHTFCNGGSGMQFYSYREVDDMDDLWYFGEAISLLTPYESIVMDGVVSFHDVVENSNLVVSVMRLGNNYLVAVTPQSNYIIKERALQQEDGYFFKLKVNASVKGMFKVFDLRNEEMMNFEMENKGELMKIQFDVDNFEMGTLLFVEDAFEAITIQQRIAAIVVSLVVGILVFVCVLSIVALILIASFACNYKKKHKEQPAKIGENGDKNVPAENL